MNTPVGKKAFTRFSEVKLDSLLQVTKAINSNYSVEQLFDIFTDILQDKLRISKFVLFINEHQGWRCAIKKGIGEEYKSISVEMDLLPIKEILATNFASDTPINFQEHTHDKKLLDIVIPVYHKAHPLAYLLIGDSEDSTEIISPSLKHLNFVQTLSSIILVAIENKKLAKENIRQAAVKKELELASHMQAMLFPVTLPCNEQIESAAFYMPHQQVGGDYYDLIWLNDNEIVFCVADVSGKGVSAALLMSNFQANLRILVNQNTTLTDLVKQLNSNVMNSAKGEKFITFFVAKYNFAKRELKYVNAAHNPPLILTKSGVNTLEKGCTGLGMFDEIPSIEEGQVQIDKSAIIVCYTDGLTELENENAEEYGIERLEEVINVYENLSMDELNKQIIKAASDYKGAQPYIDDIALFSLKLY